MAQSVVLVDYGSGNLRSVAKALERAATDAALRIDLKVTTQASDISHGDHIVLPGVGAFGHCAASLRAAPGVWDALHRRVREEHRPFLGICVGMQLMAQRGLEHGEHEGLRWISGDVERMIPTETAPKIPHMGWNEVTPLSAHPVLDASPANRFAYFVHGFHLVRSDAVIATTDYGGPVAAMVAHGTMIGTQFHPEKSQGFGLGFLAAFLKWRP
jgi:imidazole glycerol-phosphate synthase subunit HisH